MAFSCMKENPATSSSEMKSSVQSDLKNSHQILNFSSGKNAKHYRVMISSYVNDDVGEVDS